MLKRTCKVAVAEIVILKFRVVTIARRQAALSIAAQTVLILITVVDVSNISCNMMLVPRE